MGQLGAGTSSTWTPTWDTRAPPGGDGAGAAVLTARGSGGELRVGGRVAARLGRWVLTAHAGGVMIVRAAAHTCDRYWLAQAGATSTVLVLDAGTRRWRWRDVRVEGVREAPAGGEVVLRAHGVPES